MSPISAVKAAAAAPTEIPMLINGAWRAASESYEVRDPYRGSVVAIAPRSSLADLASAPPRYSIRDMTEDRMVLFNY